MNTDTLALFIKFKASGRGRILVDKLGEVVFDTQGRHILSEGAKSKYHYAQVRWPKPWHQPSLLRTGCEMNLVG